MLRASVIFSLFALQILPLVAQEKIDSVCVFRFCLRRDMFFVPYKSNEPQLEYLLAFVGRHKEEILNQRMFLIVNGYCNSLPTHKANLATAKLRSNRVKSELIVRRGLKEDCFITRNHAECGEYVTVSVHVVVSLADTLSEVGGVASVAMKTAPVRLSDTLVHLSALAVQPFMPTTVYPLPARTLMRYAPIVSSVGMRQASASPVPSRFALKTNLLYAAALLINAEAEFYFKRRLSLNLDWQYAWWSNRSKHKYYRLAAVSPELRYWFASKENFRGHFSGFYVCTGLYEFMARPTHGIQGEFFIAGGLTYGYMFSLGKRLRMEFSLGVGYMMTEYRQYHWDRGCYVYEKTQRYSYFGPTKAKVSLVWPLNRFKRKPKIE